MNEMVKTNSLKAFILAGRPKTLAGAAVPVLIGASLAVCDSGGHARWIPMLLCLLFAMVMQVDANLVNDYLDFRKGADGEGRLGPKRASQEGWITPHAMRWAIVATTLTAAVLGLPLVFFGGVEMVWIGLLCMVFCFLYTTHLAWMGMGDVLVLLFFGVIPVSATYYLALPAGGQTLTWECLLLSVACGLVVDTLLVVNNYRDISSDRRAGKQTLVVAIGPKAGRLLYLILGIVACLLGCTTILSGHLWAGLLPLVTYLPLHTASYVAMRRIGSGVMLNRVLGTTARNMLVYGLAVSVGLLFSV